jgi:AcrR family transcriptional regulator
MPANAVTPPRRRGEDTRRRAQQVALRLFTEQGYEATSLRQIADELGINKASLYYYFDGKEAIVQSLVEERGDEAEDLLSWVRSHPPSPELIRQAVTRWVDSFNEEKLQGIRFLAANPRLLRGLSQDGAEPRVGVGLSELADVLTSMLPRRTAETAVLLRMGLLSINAAVQAAATTMTDDAAIVAAARRMARIVIDDLLSDGAAGPSSAA